MKVNLTRKCCCCSTRLRKMWMLYKMTCHPSGKYLRLSKRDSWQTMENVAESTGGKFGALGHLVWCSWRHDQRHWWQRKESKNLPATGRMQKKEL
jgi:hypothetical protein